MMSKPTLASVHDKLEIIQQDIKDLKISKVDKDINTIMLKSVEDKVDAVKRDIENINGYGKWLILLIGGTVFAAILRVVIK